MPTSSSVGDGGEMVPVNLEHLTEALNRTERDVNEAMWENELEQGR